MAELSSSAIVESEVLTNRIVHTLKGNCALYVMSSVAEVCGRAERQANETGEPIGERDRAEISLAWETAKARVNIFVGNRRHGDGNPRSQTGGGEQCTHDDGRRAARGLHP